MSGHSKWSQIRRQKGINDLKKGQVYTKIAKQIVIAAKQGGGDPETNFALRMAINKAKTVNMPSDNIEKAVKKGTGDDKNASLFESVTYEAYGFDGATFVIDVLTDNRNRSAADIRMTIEKNGGRMVESGAISWQYTQCGLISIYSETEDEKRIREQKKWNEKIEKRKLPTDKKVIEDFEMHVIDIDGVTDFYAESEDNIYVISLYTQPDKLDFVRKSIESLGYDIDQAELIKKANEEIQLSGISLEKNQKLQEILEENEDVDVIWTNIKGEQL